MKVKNTRKDPLLLLVLLRSLTHGMTSTLTNEVAEAVAARETYLGYLLRQRQDEYKASKNAATALQLLPRLDLISN